MFDQLKIGSKSSYDDFEASVATRKLNKPKKKSIKETVPFSNVAYDFSAINGEVYWEERELEYVFEITGDTPAELETKRAAFVSWVMNVQNEEIHDPFIPNYHFIGTFKDINEDDDESIEKTTVTVTFAAYPYMIANEAKQYSVGAVANAESTIAVVNESSHRITPTFNSDVAFTVTIGNASYGVSAGETTDDACKLPVGTNVLKLKASEVGTVNISFYEEVF